MYRIIAILLMPFFVVGNSLAHSHGSTAHQSPNPGRAHFHLVGAHHQAHEHDDHGHSHHGHSHDHESDDSKPASAEQPIDHDSDAVYIAALDFMVTPSDRTLIETVSISDFETVDDYFAAIRPSPRRDYPHLATNTELPLYLRHAALRL